MPLLNVRLSPDDARRAAELRDEGVQISDLVREAIRAEYLRRRPGKAGARRPSLIMKEILAALPDPADMPPRAVELTDRHAVRRHIATKLPRPFGVILIDTTPLVALCDPRDGLHAKALADLDRVAKRAIVLCEPVLTEACFLLSHAVQRARLQRLVVEVGMTPLAIEDEAALRLDVFARLARYAEHEPDWADGYLAVLSGRQKAARVWTYDREFRATWRRPGGTRIPLAVR